MRVISKENKNELQFLFDTLLEVIDEGNQIVIPEILSINKTGKKFLKEKDLKENKESYISINQVSKGKEIIKNPSSIFLSLVIGKTEDAK